MWTQKQAQNMDVNAGPLEPKTVGEFRRHKWDLRSSLGILTAKRGGKEFI